MALYEPVVPARYLARLLSLVADRDPAEVAAAMAAAGLSMERLREPDQALAFDCFEALFERLQTLTGRSDLGWALGAALGWETHGALGRAIGRCTRISDVLQRVARHARLMTPSFSLELKPRADGAELLWRPTAGMSPAMLRAFYEIHVVSLHRLFVELLGSRLQPYDVELPMPRPAHAGRYRQLAGLRLQFAPQPLPAVRSRFDAAFLAARLSPLPGAAPDDGTLAASNRDFAPAERWSDWLRLMLGEAEGVQPTQAGLARLVNVSAHTLARNLAREGCGYRQIAREVRHRRACQLLADDTLDLARIAERLGYGETSNFIHAFRRIEGQSPARWRRSRRTAPPNRPA